MPSSRSAADSPGSYTIPGYRLLQEIGRGGAGVVWLARESLTGVRRAVKILPKPALAEDLQLLDRELSGVREYQRKSSGHPHLVQILHVGQTAECFYYSMEPADSLNSAPPRSTFAERPEPQPPPPGALSEPPGSDIGDYCPLTLAALLAREAPLPAGHALDITAQLLKGLVHLHAQGLMHRDVKPSNVLIVCGEVKLGDMGLVTRVDRDVTQVGTPGYMPPRDPVLDQSADVYAAGIVLYEMISGLHRSKFPELPILSPRSSRELSELRAAIHIANRAAHYDRRSRYPSAEAFLRDVEARRVSRRGLSLRTAMVLGLVAAAAGLLWILDPSKWQPTGGQRPAAAFVNLSGSEDEWRQGIVKLHYADDSSRRLKLHGQLARARVWNMGGDGHPLVIAGELNTGRLIYFRPPAADEPFGDDDVQSLDLWEKPPWTHQEFSRGCYADPMVIADLDGVPGEELAIAVAYVNCPTHIIVLSRDWKRVSHYWHYGQLSGMFAADVQGDARPELICYGVANLRPADPPNRAIDELTYGAVMVLDPLNASDPPGHWSMNDWMNATSPSPPLAYGRLADHTGGRQGFDTWSINAVTVSLGVSFPVRVNLQGCGFFDLTGDLIPEGEHRGIDRADPRFSDLPPPSELWKRTWPAEIENPRDAVTEKTPGGE